MVLPAGQAQTFTLNAIGVNADQDVAREIQLTESAIRTAAGQERFRILYNARIIGNPSGDPLDDNNLNAKQITYRDALLDAKYKVSVDEDSGVWVIDWAVDGPESLVTIYSARTTETPGPIQAATLAQIQLFFDGVSPTVTINPFIVPINGGDIDENDFGGTPSIFYEYVVVATQQNAVDHSADLKTSLVANITEYTILNLEVYKLN